MYGNSFSVIGSGYQVLWLRPLQTQKSTSALHPAAQICSQNQMTDQACTMAVAVARIHGFHSFPVKFIFIIPEIWVSSRARYLRQQAPKGKRFRCAPRRGAGSAKPRLRGYCTDLPLCIDCFVSQCSCRVRRLDALLPLSALTAKPPRISAAARLINFYSALTQSLNISPRC